MDFKTERYHNNIIKDLDFILQIKDFYHKTNWTMKEHQECINVFNRIYNRNERMVGCSACREKIRVGCVQIFEYIEKNNLNKKENDNDVTSNEE